ncbi:hypothetical protein BY996DRAFT_6623417 [Phakopsora pachyrhizi]|nr:hypothetical protein BY996DRAFT_6513389 [Phakopsora pachyrhizi]KAI8445366.1 hypothetical protein BY996DRAFT_6623417 [Phakopsora pachyrhizi]
MAYSKGKEDISRLEELRKEHEKASKLKAEAAERLKEAEDDIFDLLNRKTSISRRTSVKISPTSYETVTQISSIKPRTEHEELMRYTLQPLQRLIEKIDNPPEDGDCSSYSGYPPFCMAFVNSNHYVDLHFKNVNGSIPAPLIDGWWLRNVFQETKTCGFNHWKMI